jgi:hypothetical protein
LPNVKRICEIGFNAGASAALWLLANPTAEVIMFDMWYHHYAPVAEAMLRNASMGEAFGLRNVDSRLTIVKGSSLDTVPRFFMQHPNVKCDLLSVDGGHTYDIAVNDIKHMRRIANAELSYLVVDDTNCHAGYCVDAAVDEHLRRGSMQEYPISSAEYPVGDGSVFMRGVRVFRYTAGGA